MRRLGFWAVRAFHPLGNGKRTETSMMQASVAVSGMNFSTRSGAENTFNGVRSTAAASGSEEGLTTLGTARQQQEQPSLSTIVDIGPGPNPSPGPKKPARSFWSSIVKTATVVEEHLAEWFGLNQSKYQWAVDEYMDRQLNGELPVMPASSTAPDELQSQQMSQQVMHRNTNAVDEV